MSAVVLFSGGQDSHVCLHWARREFEFVEAIGFRYGNRHAIEVECAQAIATRYGVPYTVLELPTLPNLGEGVPVPGRNLLFLTFAAAFGQTHGVTDLVIGACKEDEATYPDCSASFVYAAELALRLALAKPIRVHAPLLSMSKAGTWQLAEQMGVRGEAITETHTCYRGDREQLHQWGYGCGECPACIKRAAGWDAYRKAA